MTSCQPYERPLDTKAQIMIFVLVVFGTLMLVGTALDVMIFQKPSKNSVLTLDDDEKLILAKNAFDPEDAHYSAKILLAFSVYTNFGKIFATQTGAGHLGCVNGIRFLSMAWVIMGHTYVFGVLIFCKRLVERC